MIAPSEQYSKGLLLQSNVQSQNHHQNQHQQQQSTNPPLNESDNSQSQFSSYAKSVSDKLATDPEEQSRINFDYYNALVYYSTLSNFAASPSQSAPSKSRRNIQLKTDIDNFRTDVNFPAIRLYNPIVGAYLSRSNSSREIVAVERNPFSSSIEWEWIPQPHLQGVFLRNLVSKHFFCFNRNGRPTVRRRLNYEFCLLRGSMRFYDVTQRPSKSSKKRSTAKTSATPPISKSTGAGNKGRNKDVSRRKRGFRELLIPGIISLTSYNQTPQWRIGFCKNGHAFANRNPYSEKCSNFQLPQRWDQLYICSPVPPSCRIPACQASNPFYNDQYGCPYSCRSSIFCGDTSKRVRMVNS